MCIRVSYRQIGFRTLDAKNLVTFFEGSGDPLVEVTEESRDAYQKAKGMVTEAMSC
jgi:hypothetical protein